MELEIILVFAKCWFGTKFGKLGGMEMVNILVFVECWFGTNFCGVGRGMEDSTREENNTQPKKLKEIQPFKSL
jgi:hypothetical protein